MLKKDAAKELIKCAQDPVYFLNTYAKIQHPVKGLLPFKTFPYQNDIIRGLLDHRLNIVLKARQLGVTTIAAGFIAWFILFKKDKNVLVVATKQDVAKNTIRMIRNIVKYLPPFFQVLAKTRELNKTSIELEHGSRVKAITTASDAGRSEAVSFLFIDEVAHIEKMDELWTGIWPTISAGGRAMLASTPNGTGNFFHQQFTQAQNGENNFNCRFGTYTNPENPDEVYADRFMWWVHPEHDRNWFEQETKGRNARDVAQEYLCFGEETQIVTSLGFKSIKDVKIGDLVLTHKGRFKKVINAKNRISNDVFSFKTFLNKKETLITAEHPILSELNGWIEAKNVNEKDLVCSFPKNVDIDLESKTLDLFKILESQFFKIKLSDDQRHIFLNDRRHKKIHNRFVEVDYDLGRFIGLYLAEGHIAKNTVNFSFNYSTELDTWVKELIDIVYVKFGIQNCKIYHKDNSGTLTIASNILVNFIKKLTNGYLAVNKSLSDYSYLIKNKQFLTGFVDGVFQGDGCIKEQYDKTLNIVSEKLIYDVKYALEFIGIGRLSIRKGSSGKVSTILGREVQTNQQFNLKILKTKNIKIDKISDLIGLNYAKNNTSYKNFHNENNNFFLSSVISKQKYHKPITVYNIEVEEDNSFTTEHFVVHNCSFNASGATFLLTETLLELEKNIKEPIHKDYIDRNLWIWKEPDPIGVYIIPSDVASGLAADYTTFHVLRVDTKFEQVAEYRGKITPDLLGNLLVDVAKKYNNATVAPENNAGWSGQTILRIRELGYPFLYYTSKNPGEIVDIYTAHLMGDKVPGYVVTPSNRIQMLGKMEQYLRMGDLIVYSSRTIDELKTFVWANDRKPQAARSYFDDLVMGLAAGCWIKEASFMAVYRNDDMKKALIGAISTSKREFSMPQDSYNLQNIQHAPANAGNKYKLANGQVIDLSWLIKSG